LQSSRHKSVDSARIVRVSYFVVDKREKGKTVAMPLSCQGELGKEE